MAQRFNFGEPLDIGTSTTARLAGSRFSKAPREDVVFVDVGTRKIDANITRDDVPIGAIPIDKARFDDFFNVRPEVTTKVVSQSVAPGTAVPVGATIDLVMAEPRNVPIGLVDGVLTAFRDEPIGNVFDQFVRDNTDVKRVLARTDRPQALSSEDAQTISSVFGDQITGEPGADVDAAFQTLKAALVFGG